MRSDRFADRIAIVTGAAQGIGRGVALQLAREGATVVAADRDARWCHDAVDQISREGGRAVAAIVDLETAAGARALVKQALDAYGRIDVSVHCVGGTIWGKPLWEYEEEQIELEIRRSLWPALWCNHAVIPHMLARRKGAIVNIGSSAVRSIYRVPYAAAKGGVHAMTVSMAQELGDCGVRVNCVAPGGIDGGPRNIPRNPHPLSAHEQELKKRMTAKTIETAPLARYGKVDEVVSAVCYFASDEASYITGQVLYVAGGANG